MPSWTERPHWIVMARDPGETEHCIGHYAHRKDAAAHAARARQRYAHAWVAVTAADTEAAAQATERDVVMGRWSNDA